MTTGKESDVDSTAPRPRPRRRGRVRRWVAARLTMLVRPAETVNQKRAGLIGIVVMAGIAILGAIYGIGR